MLRISAKGEYAIRAVLDLAVHDAVPVISIQEIASRQRIPQRYLEQVLLQLKRAGFLLSRRGAAGGYHLTKSSHEITVGAVLRAVDGSDAAPTPLGRQQLGAAASPELDELWDELSAAVSQVVDRVTFGDLALRAAARRESVNPIYHI